MKTLFYNIIILSLFSGCTQLITAPISVAGSVVGTGVTVSSKIISTVTPD